MMMRKNIAIGFLILLFFALVSACVRKPQYPTEPIITYKEFIRYGNPSDPDSATVVISFTDNEGDIGLGQGDTFGLFKQGNLWMTYLYDSANNNLYVPFNASIGSKIFDTLKVAYRVPIVLPKNETAQPMKGLIYVKMAPFIKIHNKIKYDIVLYDKSLHKSNIVRTDPIIF